MRFPNKENNGMERESKRFSQCNKNWNYGGMEITCRI